jgi:hypothetical protein
MACWLFNFGRNARADAETLTIVTLAPLNEAPPRGSALRPLTFLPCQGRQQPTKFQALGVMIRRTSSTLPT